MRRALALILVSFFVVAPSRLHAQALSKPQADGSRPVEKSSAAKREASDDRETPPPAHAFLDLQGKILNSANVGVATLDAVGTCRTLAAGGHEDWLPTQHCAPASAMIGLGLAFDISLSYIFHRTGHHKLERIMEFVAPVDSIAGVTSTVTHGGHW
jgi:hypothetical protein